MRHSRIHSAGRAMIFAAIPLALSVAASSASAQYSSNRYPNGRDRNVNSQQEIFEWAGRVDREIQIQANRNNAEIIKLGSNERNNNGRMRTFAAIPRQAGTVTVQVLEGRGKVDVIQQPTARNGYTTVIRMRDPDGGASRYRIAAYFTPNGYNRNGRPIR
jgi:hypothetical protein